MRKFKSVLTVEVIFNLQIWGEPETNHETCTHVVYFKTVNIVNCYALLNKYVPELKETLISALKKTNLLTLPP